MTHAYNEIYLNDARENLAIMVDYLINDCGYNSDWAAELFLKSGYARLFETGNPSVISGMSGIELAKHVIATIYGTAPGIEAKQTAQKSKEAWAGNVLASYQWHSGYRFSDILEKIRLSKLIDMYDAYHDLDLWHFYDVLNQKMKEQEEETRLKKIREATGMSQKELAQRSGVRIRSIQMYEQRNNDIDKAQAHTLYKLAVTLGCRMEDLLEDPMQ